MTSAASRSAPSADVGVLGVGSAALAVGAGAFALAPTLGAAVVALPIGLLVLASPAVGTALLLFVLPLEELAAIAPGGGLTLHKLLGVGVIGAWLLRALVMRQPIVLPLVSLWVGGFLVWAVASALWAVEPGTVIRTGFTFAQLAALYVLVVNVLDTPGRLRLALGAHVAGATALAAIGLVIAQEGILQAGRAAIVIDRQLVVESNAFGGALVLPLVVALVGAVDGTRRFLERAALGVAGLVCATALVLTLSRGPLVALAVALVLVSAARRQLWVPVAGVAVALPGLVLVGPALWERLVEGVTLADRGAGRLDIWRVGWAVVRSHPLAGVGLGCFPAIYATFLSEATGISWRHVMALMRKSDWYPHNIYVGTTAELGAFGIALLLALLAAHLRSAAVAWRRLDVGAPAAALALTAGAGLAALAVEGVSFDVLHRKYTWLALGLAAAAPRLLAAPQRS